MQVIMSDVGIALLFAVLGTWTYYRGFSEVVTYYLIPYLYVNHWVSLAPCAILAKGHR